MKQTTFQHPELRDANDNIIQQGAFGKNTALANSTNDGWIDYVANDLEALYNNTMGGTGGEINTETITGKTGTITNLTATTVKAGTVTADALNGPLTGNVTGDLNGNVTGDVTGNLTGNVTGTADKAVADGSGNNIVNTYVTKSGLSTSVSTTSLTVSGTTSVPTANAGNSSKAIANTEFVAKSIASLVNGAPDQLNTLNELAKALGNDANFSATITAELAKKLNSTEAESTYLPLSGGTLTGAINTANATWNKLGDDASFGDHNIAGKMCIKTQTARNTGIAFFNETDTNVGQVEVNNAFDFNKPVKENGGFLVPIGIVQAFAGRTMPQGWLLCDGSAVSRTDYAALYAVIGTTYGAGNGSTTFNLPNLTDKFIQGSATAGTVKSAGLPNITGDIGFTISNMQPTGAFGFTTKKTCPAVNGKDANYNANIDASRSSSIYGNSNTVQPPALTMRYIIKY